MATSKYTVAVWATGIASLGVVDWLLAREGHGNTLSEATRYLVTEIPGGKGLFLVGWGTLSAWFIHHILDRPTHS